MSCIQYNIAILGNTLLEGVCIRLTRHEYEGFLCMFMTTVIKCHSLSYVIFNVNMTFYFFCYQPFFKKNFF